MNLEEGFTFNVTEDACYWISKNYPMPTSLQLEKCSLIKIELQCGDIEPEFPIFLLACHECEQKCNKPRGN